MKLLRTLLVAGASAAAIAVSGADSSLENRFAAPPDDIKTGVYWYWIEGNITEDGVIKDLEAMKRAGINRAFIANIGGAGTGDPNALHKVEFMGEEWWRITHAALKRASELGIEIGIFNSPGWSQSGGPWIKPNQTMRYLASTRRAVKGPGKVTVDLPEPVAEFEDVKVIAFPNPVKEESVLTPHNASVSVTPAAEGMEAMFDGDNQTGMTFAADGVTTVDFKARAPFTARSVVVRALPSPLSTEVEVQALDKDGNYTTVSRFQLHRVRDWKKVGFDPYADVAMSFEPVTSEAFRVIFHSGGTQNGIAELTLSGAPRVERFKEKSLAKLFQTEVPAWEEYLWREQPEAYDSSLGLPPKEVIDISECLQPDGTLVWDVPAGDWIVMRSGMAPTGVVNEPACPDATGYEVDKLSREHAESHFNDYIGQILERIPQEDRRCFKVLVQDSYEVGGQNFTDNMIEIFRERYGYDPLPYLPVLEGYVVGSQHDSDAFLWDLRRLVADRISYEYVGGTREVAHRHGLTTWLENYGHWGFPGEFLQYGGQADEVGGEFWADPPYGEIENRLATSCSHIYGKPLTSSESSTSAGPAYLRTPDDLKPRMDRYFTYGINNTVLHLYIHQPDELRLPGSNAWFGTEFDRNNTWFKHMDLYTDYIKRCNLMMRQGWYQSDVAYFIGEDAPRMVGKMEPWIPAGYQFEHINAEVIIRDLEVKDGLLTLPHGITFKALVLPPTLKTMRPELLRKIEQLVREGGIVVGPAPERSPSLEHGDKADKEVRKLARKVWGDVDGDNVKQRRYGKGMVFHGMEFADIFSQLGYPPDCKVPDGLNIYQGHQKDGDTDIYILSNQEGRPVTMDVAFRLTGKQPELWEPLTGSRRTLPAYSFTEQTTIVPVKLDKGECVFVVFREPGNGGSGDIATNYPAPRSVKEITTPWDVTFEGAFKTPAPIRLERLENLSENAADSIRYFSGNITYTTTTPLRKAADGERQMLTFNKVGTMGKVYVNGKYAGGVWTTPYRVDITDLVIDGDNEIRVEVANTWVNRIVGDLNLPEEERDVYLFVNPHHADSPLPPSGITGPVAISNY